MTTSTSGEHRVKGGGVRATEALAAARLALAVVLGLRLALSPFAAAVGQPQALWQPRGTGLIFRAPPPVALVCALQIVGVAGVGLYLWRRRLATLALGWMCLLVLAGLRTSLGKILHNDVLLLLAAVPLLLAGAPRRGLGGGGADRPGVTLDDVEARRGLDAAAAIVLLSYFSAGWWKVLRSGPAWAFSDNLRWSLAAGRAGSRWPGLTSWLVAHPVVCSSLAVGLLVLELSAPLLWFQPRLVPLFVAAAVVMHGGTWLVLGLDYWAHLATVALVLLPWARMRKP